MNEVITVALTRDIEAVQIPSGNTVALPTGTAVSITQTLGGSFTVECNGALFRIAGKDADALGREAPPETEQPAAAGEQIDDQIWAALKTVYDPEIPVNIVDLGLVYDMRRDELKDGGYKVDVKMTLTAQGCGMGPVIAGDAQNKLLEIDRVKEASVEVVWDPPWHQSMISEEGRKILGLE